MLSWTSIHPPRGTASQSSISTTRQSLFIGCLVWMVKSLSRIVWLWSQSAIWLFYTVLLDLLFWWPMEKDDKRVSFWQTWWKAARSFHPTSLVVHLNSCRAFKAIAKLFQSYQRHLPVNTESSLSLFFFLEGCWNETFIKNEVPKSKLSFEVSFFIRVFCFGLWAVKWVGLRGVQPWGSCYLQKSSVAII